MNRSARRALLPLACILLLGACTSTPSPSASSSPALTPEPTPSSSPSETATSQPSPSVTPSVPESTVPSASASATIGPGGFGIPSNPGADALFLDRDECQSSRDGYRLDFPEDWWTNTDIGKVPSCSWFSPTFYEVPDPNVVPDEIAIEIFVVSGVREYPRRVLSSENIVVGGTQPAVRLEIDGTADGSDGGSYEYVVQLGPTLEQGPNLVARTDTKMGGTFDINRGVLDRMMATMRFFGSVQ